MYKVFKKNLEGFERLFADDCRYGLSRPLFLLADLKKFNEEKNSNSKNYQSLLRILKLVSTLKNTQKYHGFNMFLNELHLQMFDFETDSVTDFETDETLEYQVSLLWQFMFPAYYS